MDMKDLIAPRYRAFGFSCQNCTHLMSEYDSELRGKGVWVCNQKPAYSESKGFPFKYEMPCFELSFSLSIFAQDLRGSDESYESALNKFTESLAQLNGEAIHPAHLSGAERESRI